MVQGTDDLYDRALELASRPKGDVLELAHTLRALKEQDPGRYEKFLRKAGISLRKAYYLVGISKKLASLRLSKAQLRRMGWWKLAILARHITKENKTILMALAAENTAKDLPAAIERKAGIGQAQLVRQPVTI